MVGVAGVISTREGLANGPLIIVRVLRFVECVVGAIAEVKGH